MNAKLRTRALSLMLTILMLFSTFTVFPVSAGASAATLPLVWDFTGEPTLAKQLSPNDLDVYPSGIGVFNANLNFSGNTGDTVGLTDYNSDDKALDLLYTKWGALGGISSNYRVTFRPKTTKPSDRPYVVVTYRTDAAVINSVTPKMYFSGWSASQGYQLLSNDVSVSRGEWVKTAPLKLNDTLFNRILGNHCAIHMTYSNDESFAVPQDINFQIKSITFFATEAEANEYAFDPLIIDMSSQTAAENHLVFSPSPESGLTGTNTDWGTNAGHYAFDAEEKALVIKKSTSDQATSLWRYLMFTNKNAPTKLAECQKYMVVVYKTDYNGDTAAAINLNRFTTSATEQLQLEDDVRVSGGKWVRTEAVNISNRPSDQKTDLFYRLYNSSAHDMIVVMFPKTESDETCLYIKEIGFFKSVEEANAYYLENPIENPEPDTTADITLTANVPAEIVPGETFVADITASTTKDAAKELTSTNLTLTYSDTLTLKSIVAADGIGGEGVQNGNNYGWYFDGETPVAVTKDTPVVIAKASFTASADLKTGDTVEVGFADTEDALNVALKDDTFQTGFKPDAVKGTATAKISTFKFTVPAGFTAFVNDGASIEAGATTDVKAGDKLVLTAIDADMMIKSVAYKYGDGAETAITAVNGTYTVPTDAVNGDITVTVTTYDYSFIEADEYMALAADQKILVLPVTTAGTNDTTYAIGDKPLYYSSRYDAYVAIVDVNATPAAIGAALTVTATPATAVEYKGDINRDGKITAGDAALISSLLHSYTSDSKASDRPAVTDIMRLEADVCGKYVTGGAYVSVVDSTWVLYASVGLIFDAPEEEVKIEGIIIPTTSYAEANKKLDIYSLDTFPTDYENGYGSNVGKYEFDPLETAFSLKHANNTYMGSNFKFHLILDKSVSSTVTDESWMVMTYRTNYNGATKASIKLANNQYGDDIVTLADDISVSGGEYVFSTPVNLNGEEFEGNGNLFDRLKNRVHSALIVTMPEDTNDEDTYFFIKEIAFFDSEKMAKAYIANTELPEANTDTYTKFKLYNMDSAKADLFVFNNDYITKGDNHTYNKDNPGQVGEYRFHDDQQALEILESVRSLHGVTFRFHVQTRAKNVVGANEQYMVILYRTNIESAGKITLNNNGWGDNKAVVAEDLSVSDDKWVYSTPVDINAEHKDGKTNLFDRIRNSTPLPLSFDMPRETDSDYKADQYLFVKEILFFSSLEAANRYIANVPVPKATEVVYGQGLSKDEWVDPVAISFKSAEKTALNSVATGDITYTTDGARLTGSVAPQFKNDGCLLNNHVLAALSYKTTAAGTIKIGDTVIAADTTVSAGNFVYTDAFELTDAIKSAFNGGTANTITYTGSGELILGELVFFSNTKQLETYVSEFEKAATGTYYDGKLGEFSEITVLEGEGFGEWSYSDEDVITLENNSAEKYDSAYYMTYKFVNRDEILDKAIQTKPIDDRNLTHFYMRVAYKADNGSGDGVQLVTVNPASGVTAVLADVENTNGEWVLSDAIRVPNDILEALSGHGAYFKNDYEELHHLPAVLAFTNTEDDAEYSVKNIYFFKTAADAVNFKLPADKPAPESVYTVGGTKLDSVSVTAAVDTAMAADSYKIYVDGTALKASAGSAEALEIAENVAEMRVLGGDTYLDVVDITLAAGFALNGTVGAGEPTETITLKYDDRYTFSKAVAYIDSETVTSTDAVTGEADVSLLRRTEGETFAASGIGEGTVYFLDGTSVKVTVTAAPLSVIMMAGQSNTEGAEGNHTQSIRNTNGQVYSTYASAGFRYIGWMMGNTWRDTVGTDVLTIYNPGVFVPQSLTTNVSYTGNRIKYPLDMLNTGANGKSGMDSAIAYEWNKQTGEKVWVINVAHSGSGISLWQPGAGKTDNNFWQAVGIMKLAEETVQAEIAAGHYTLSHMGYFWLQGCSNKSTAASSYLTSYNNMHEGFLRELAFDHDSDPSTADRTFEFGGILLVRRGGDEGGSTINNKPADYYLTGPRLAQYMMGNEADNGLFLVSNIGDYWRSDADVANYFTNKYGTNENFKAQNGGITYNMPTTIKQIHPGIHYQQNGYNELGRDAVHNLLRQAGFVTAEQADITFKLLDDKGVVTDFAGQGVTIAKGAKVTIVPDAAPRYLAASVEVSTSANITHDGYYAFTSTDGGAGTITFTCGGTSVTVNVNAN